MLWLLIRMAGKQTTPQMSWRIIVLAVAKCMLLFSLDQSDTKAKWSRRCFPPAPLKVAKNTYEQPDVLPQLMQR